MSEFIFIIEQLIGKTEAFAFGLAIGGLVVLFTMLFAQHESKDREG